MNRTPLVIACLALTLLTVPPVSGQTLSFTSGGGPLSLTVSTATAGSEPNDATDSGTELSWDTEGAGIGKITVSTSCPGQSFSLGVTLTVTSWATGTSGTEQGEIMLIDGMLDTDLFRDIPSTLPGRQGYGTLTYRASASVSQGHSGVNGDDFHIITYSIIAQ